MQGFAAGDGGVWVYGLECLGAGVPQRPTVAGSKFRMCGISPLGEHLGDLAWRDGTAVRGPDDEVMCSAVREPEVPVGGDAGFHADQPLTELADCTGGQLPEIPDGEPGMFAPDLDQPGKRQIIANEDPCARHDAGREGFVMAVSQAHNPSVAVLKNVPARGHLNDAEVAVAIVADRMCLPEEVEAGIGQLAFYFHDKLSVR